MAPASERIMHATLLCCRSMLPRASTARYVPIYPTLEKAARTRQREDAASLPPAGANLILLLPSNAHGARLGSRNPKQLYPRRQPHAPQREPPDPRKVPAHLRLKPCFFFTALRKTWGAASPTITAAASLCKNLKPPVPCQKKLVTQ